VQTADCVPILLAAKDGSAAAAVHAGWRGTFARILPELAGTLTKEGYDLSNWVAAIGPCIGECCYEVSEELALDFRRKFDALNIETETSRPRHLNLARINAAELQKLGIGAVETLPHCTRCSTKPRFNSYRRDGSGGRQWSVIKFQTK
jgi:YfiH family protein